MKNPGIYILTSPDRKTYVGKAINLQRRVREHLSLKTPNCKAVHRAIKKYGAENMRVETIHYPGISHEALCEVEKHKIIQLGSHKSEGGYNLTWGGDGLDSETASEHSRKRLAAGTHNFAGEQGSKRAKENNLKRVREGTHHFAGEQGSKFAREKALKRLKEGTHHFAGEQGTELHRKRLAAGTHHFAGEQGSKLARENNLKRLAAGTHNLVGEQGSKLARENNLKRLAAGTHHFLNSAVARKSHYIKRMNNKARRRELYRHYAVLLYSRAVDGMHIYQKRQREGFFDTDIPDTSRAEQTEIGFLP